MTPDDRHAPSRRALRQGRVPGAAAGVPETGSATAVVEDERTAEATPSAPVSRVSSTAPVETADGSTTPPAAPAAPVALTWVTEASLVRSPGSLVDPAQRADEAPDLLARRPRRSPFRPSVIIPTLLIACVAGAYAAVTLLWPLHAVPPVVEASVVEVAPAAPAAPAWPAVGTAAISVAGIPGSLSTTSDPQAIASITKVVTALVVLEEMPLTPGEQGPEFRFTSRDRSLYWSYRQNGESAVDVPVGGSLTQFQMLQGMLIGSANNYADRLAGNIWPTDAVFAAAANSWLRSHGVPGVTIVEPTGMDPRNVATPEALLVLATKALANPVIASIVATPEVELPGVGLLRNTNGLLADPGVVGIKTGSLDIYNLLSAKNITIGDTVVRTYASVLGQPDNESRLAASRALYAQLEAELQRVPSVTAGTTVGRVTTEWGEDVPIVTAEDASVILWNGGAGTPSTTFSLGDARTKGADVGTLTVTGPLDQATVDLRLSADIEPPSAWWRLTHPLDLLGLN